MTKVITEQKTASGTGLFGKSAWRFAFYAVLIPNIVFLLIMPMIIMGRVLTPLLFLLAGLIALRAPKWLNYLMFLGIAVLDLILIISLAFHLRIGRVIESFPYLFDINIFEEPLYVFGPLMIAGMALLAAFLINKHRENLRGFSPLMATVSALAICFMGYRLDMPHVSKYQGPVDSAVLQTKLAYPAVDAPQKNLLIVMVEGMGAFDDPHDRAQLENYITRALDGNRFEYSKGETYFHGSTTGSAARELCGEWGDHKSYFGAESFDCLPRRYGDAGYATYAYHGFTQNMFARDKWYPRIGFEHLYFQEQLEARDDLNIERRCGGVFEGLCDEDVARLVKAEMTQLSEPPKMLYWLTLNSHIPFDPLVDGPLNCDTENPAIAPKDVCQLTELWGQVFDDTLSIANDPNLPPTDILIVGDHHTPMVSRVSKTRFTRHKVDWYLLRDKRLTNEVEVASR